MLDKGERFTLYAVWTYGISWVVAVNWFGRPAGIAYAFFNVGVIFFFAIWLNLHFKKK